MIKIQNIRLGMATNSSSTHSIIFLGGASDCDVTGEFGWSNFTCASKEAKELYLSTQLYYTIDRMCKNPMFSAAVVEQLMGKNVLDVDEKGMEEYVDHQSMMNFPIEYKGYAGYKDINREFFNDFKNFLMKENVVVLGGNDNDDEPHPLYDEDKQFKMAYGFIDSYDNLVAKKDGDWWILFNQRSGAKIRMSFEDSPKKYTKSLYPELVDVKITNFCDNSGGCSKFCYQNSKTDGVHADCNLIYRIAEILGGMKTFKVALGGGETTKHPRFVDILRTFREKGIVPNFTTRSLDWLRDNAIWPKVMEYCGGFAYSIQNSSEISKFASLLINNDLMFDYRSENPISIQYVMGSTPFYQFANILREARQFEIRVTLLGYKSVGKGSNFKPEDYKGWLQECLKLQEKNELPRISIDTLLAKDYRKQLEEADIPSWLFSVKEGQYSMYMDLVDLKMGPSSYDNGKNMVEIPHHINDWDKRAYIDDKNIEEIKKIYKTF